MMKLIFVLILSFTALLSENLIDKNILWKPIIIKIDNISKNTSVVENKNLKVGQSGIVLHVYESNNKIIVSNAKVISSTNGKSIVEFVPFNDLKQVSVPTTKRNVEVNDILILNYLYTSAMIIAPTQESFLQIRNSYKYNNFLHADLFATWLKMEDNPFPSKTDIQEFAISQNLGTVFIVVKDSLYILDTKTFKVLDKREFLYKKVKMQKPFYSRVEKIKSGSFDFDLANKKALSYDEYYQEILGLK